MAHAVMAFPFASMTMPFTFTSSFFIPMMSYSPTHANTKPGSMKLPMRTSSPSSSFHFISQVSVPLSDFL